MKVDKAFENYFKGRLKQVFYYVTDRCNLRCEHCLYKSTLSALDMKFDIAFEMLSLYKDYGAEKLTFIGGEPTLYGSEKNHIPLFDLINHSKNLGYRYVRLDTNGQFDIDLFDNDKFKKLDNLAFSIDGHLSEINDSIRGKNSYNKCVKNIKEAVNRGYYTTITSCIFQGNLEHIEELIWFASSLGAKEINLHPLFIMGVERDNFTGSAHIKPEVWMTIYQGIREKIDNDTYDIKVRIPQRFVEISDYHKDKKKYEYCPVRMGERVLVHPDGKIRICALCIGSPYHIARHDNSEISFGASNNEIDPSRLERRPCMSQTKDFGGLIPLCISYKPYQSEYVWEMGEFDSNYEAFYSMPSIDE